jgi:hypothetical protein
MIKTIRILLVVVLIFCFSYLLGKALELDKVRYGKYDTTIMLIEYAYFEGQKDALNGDIRIKKEEGSENYIWSRSPWDDDDKIIFDPKKHFLEMTEDLKPK